MQRILAIAWLTVKAALRYRLVLVLGVVLIGSVILLPLIIKDDGTAQGLTQILLTYTLTLITTLLGFTTLWLACGTLAREVEEAQMQMVAVKPIARWQIWIGKWLGILALNGGLLAVSSAAVFVLLQMRANQLPAAQQAILRSSIMVARGSLREPAPNYEQDAEKLLQSRIKENPEAAKDIASLRQMARERVKAAYQIVPPDYRREWKIDMGWRKKYLEDKPLFLRIKFNVAEYAEGKTFLGLWEIGEPGSNNVYREQMSLAADTFHEFKIPAHLIGPDGILRINFINRNQTGLLFQFEDGLEVLYPEGSFGLNFSRGVAIIFCWLALLGALGLTCASFLSFPVAAFSSLGILLLALSTGTLKQIVDENGIMEVNHETGVIDHPSIIDAVAVPVSKGLLKLLNLVRDFSPIDALSSGRSISWPLLGLAFGQIVVLMCGIFALIGISIFNRRELATGQSSH
jgi:hypothetical protein